MNRLLAVPRITRGEIDAALRIDDLRRRAAEADHHALTQLCQGWPEYVPEAVARALMNAGERRADQ